MPLNIDWQQILLHLLNFVILFAALYFLLYKPVKNFMDKRVEYYKNLDDETKKKLAEAETARKDYTEKLNAADEEIKKNKELSRKKLDEMSSLKLEEARAESAKIVAEAQERAKKEYDRIISDAQTEISDMIVNATEKLVLGESTSEAYDQFLNAAERGDSDEQNE